MKKIFSILLLLIAISSYAQDRYFGQTYTSDILQKGGVDLEVWHTSRFGHSTGFYHGMDQRMELELGLGGKVQTSFYFNRFQEMEGDSNGINSESEIGFSNEWKYRITRPSAKYGIALYGELGVKGDELEWEGKFIIDHAAGKNLFAANLVAELEQEVEKVNNKYALHTSQTPVELDLAYMRFIKPDLGIGFELRNNNRIVKGNWQNSILFGGPTLNYRAERWFVIVNYLPQWVNLHKSLVSPGNKDLVNYERNEIRLLFGISL